jgi:hypothetical protein
MDKDFVLVSSLFNIKRDEMNDNDGRSWDDYLNRCGLIFKVYNN